MIATVFGIILLAGAAYWLIVALRAYPPGSLKSGRWLRQSTWSDIVIGVGFSLGCLIGGLLLLR